MSSHWEGLKTDKLFKMQTIAVAKNTLSKKKRRAPNTSHSSPSAITSTMFVLLRIAGDEPSATPLAKAVSADCLKGTHQHR